ncbi:hypothetical protein [Sphingomicrobium clamense]|uniref:DoxX family protein n=1 Tax=Sphingomicrobium clamense TaxID=2851013 RepID=A0ABS6V313_9SPHN|nr:hypothetical protein [Sphingomicrobium sp. B8]MBW0143957.1 hypothetical protein [Sphingomicrobium sp. B8]
MSIVITLLRLGFGAWFAFWGIAPLFGIAPPPTTEPAALALLDANRGTFSMQLAQASFVVGGLLLLVPRTAPLGLAILAPTVIWIFLFHATLTASFFWGASWFAAFLVLVWWYRDAFRPLVGLNRKATQ